MRDTEPRLLLIDDSLADIVVLAELLKDMAGVVFATNGADGLKRALTERFDAILLDVRMPDMDGFEVCRRLRAEGIDTPMVFVSSLGDTASEELGLNLGAVDYIAKPIVPSILRARVRNHLLLGRATRDLREANQRLTHIAAIDSLTGAYSRHQFLQLAEQEIQRSDRHGHPLVLLMLDLDHFKLINDTCGHACGDSVLMAVVGAWQRTLRAEDVLGRVGGEEFVTLLPQTALDAARRAADRLLDATRRLAMPGRGADWPITVSIGVAERPPLGGDLAGLMRRADQALYAAKRAGRDRAAVAAVETASGTVLRPMAWRGSE